jgi:hypothetical protein
VKYKLRRTEQYDKWFARVKDRTVKLKVLARLARVENGNFGDFSQLGEDLFELRFFFANRRPAHLLNHPGRRGGTSAGGRRQIDPGQGHCKGR